MLKKICYYPPSLTKKSRLRSKRQHNGKIDPNFEVYQYYQQNVKTANNGALPQGLLNGEDSGDDQDI